MEVEIRHALAEYTLTIVTSYADLKTEFTKCLNEPVAYHTMLADTYLPLTCNSQQVAPVPLLIKEFQYTLIRGIGIFLPHFVQTQVAALRPSKSFEQAIVANRGCWLSDGRHDWKKMFDLVQDTLAQGKV